MRHRRLWLAALAAAALLWLAGFAWFLAQVPDRVADPDSDTDAIVVLTGGSQRIEGGIKLLLAGKAKWLFVTGVHPGITLPELLRQSAEKPTSACCIVLGHVAESTYGNALETSAFMRAHGFRSLRLVTASYHMPRSVLEFSHAMPDVRIVPNPVFPEPTRGRWAGLRPSTFALLAEEYMKYLLSLTRTLVPAAS